MDFQDLLKGAPDLTDNLKGLGLSDEKLGDFGHEVGSQLAGGDGFDLSDLLAGLDADSFLSRIDIASLATKVGISSDTATAAISMIAPAVAEFMGGGQGSALGSIGGLASKLFKR